MNRTMLFPIAMLAIVFAACTSSKISYSWKSEAPEPSTFNKIVVIAMNGEKDASLRPLQHLLFSIQHLLPQVLGLLHHDVRSYLHARLLCYGYPLFLGKQFI